MENNKLRELAKEFCNKNKYMNEDDLYIFLVENQWKIYADYQKQSLKNVVKQELDEQGFDVKNISEGIIEQMAFSLDELIFDEDNFRDCMNQTIDWYKEDLEEYKLEENDNE